MRIVGMLQADEVRSFAEVCCSISLIWEYCVMCLHMIMLQGIGVLWQPTIVGAVCVLAGHQVLCLLFSR
jgi:hypothetical protein